jgi:hypothetical protein
MQRLAALSTGTKLMLASSILLFFDLFVTWQKIPQEYGSKFDVTDNLDAWDGWGLLLALATLAVLTLLIIRETNVELSPEVPWSRITLGLAVSILAIAVVKNLLDAHSAWGSYAGIALAAVCVFGAYLDRDRVQPERERPFSEKWKPRVRASAGAGHALSPEQRSEEPRAARSSRW